MTTPIEIDSIPENKICYSICTLVSSQNEYEGMLASFEQAGFSSEDCEYLYVNNIEHNKYDAYQAIRKFLLQACGRYIIFCHQDVLLSHDNRMVLEDRIQAMDALDNRWAILGNAGGHKNLAKRYVRITDPHGDNQHVGSFPCLVSSVDENFILVKREANISVSCDLSGFHFYGTDLCLLAQIRGYRCYVIDFHLTHKSAGKRDRVFDDCQKRFIEKYQRALKPRWVRTVCAALYLSSSRFKTKIFNQPYVMRKLKRLCRIVQD
ncbi:MAG: hypothetical protein A2X77_04255 [Gammaproteobacteria bacterium GWE2_42_36]|nr:MAG: hypothetical protein A2X77_04255 [Gammaproteobacteria bacterium GWE2_42_36]HCU05332.1 acyl esterase [Coxiellaceae bacterium]